MRSNRVTTGRLSGILFALIAGLAAAGCAAKSSQSVGPAQLANRVATCHPTVVEVTGSVVRAEPRATMTGVPLPFLAFIHGIEYSRYVYRVVGAKGEADVSIRVTKRRGRCVSAEWMVNGEEFSEGADEILAETGDLPRDSPPAVESPPVARVE